MNESTIISRRQIFYAISERSSRTNPNIMEDLRTHFPRLTKEGRYWIAKIDVKEGWIEFEYGVIGTDKPTKKKRKIITKGKKTMEEQCLQEIRQRYKEKIQDEYKEDEEVSNEIVTLPSRVNQEREEEMDEPTPDDSTIAPSIYLTPSQLRLPMLAVTFASRAEKKKGITFPMWAQPKANGVRGIFVMTPSGVQIYSRTLHSYCFMTSLRKDVEKILSVRPDIVFDGEIYAQGTAGQDITSIAAQKKTPHPEEDKLKLWLFDCYVPTSPSMTYLERRSLLEELLTTYKTERVVLMESVKVDSMDELEVLNARYHKAKWEGTMLRLDSPYEHRRSLKLIKYKFAQEMDTLIAGIESTEGDDVVLILKMDNEESFTHRPEGSMADKQEWLENPEMVIGRTYSFSYTHLSEDGLPLAIHNGMIRFDM